MRLTDKLRWLFLIPSALVGWWIALFIGIFLYSVVDSFCPPELVVSGACTATWHTPVINGLIVFGASLSAAMVILCAVYMAPSNRALVALITFISGVLFAVYVAYETSEWTAFVGAFIAGFGTMLYVKKQSPGAR